MFWVLAREGVGECGLGGWGQEEAVVRGFPEQERPPARCPPTPRSCHCRKGALAVAVGKRDWWGEVGVGDKGWGGA